MNKTISLLQEKNMYLEKFLGLNRERMDRLAKNDFSELEDFRETRESILNIVRHIDALIEAQSEAVDSAEVSSEMRLQIQCLLDRKDALVRAILAQDLDIMQFIDEAKSRIIHELQNVKKGRKTIGLYKSYNRKEIVDEEA